MQNFRALGASPQTPIGLRRLGALPPDPQNSPPLRISVYAPGPYTDVFSCASIGNTGIAGVEISLFIVK